MSEKDTTSTKKPIYKRWWFRIPLVLLGLSLLLGQFTGGGGLPACDSSRAKGTLAKAFDQSQFARNMGLAVVEIKESTELTSSIDKKKDCFAKITMNNANTVPVLYQLALRDNGSYMLTFEVQE
ncbi:exported hypothetical protein [Candidatus Terasakiella magnetica]|uniref:Uncharacterized protein n=1 Tax=Candidatus Terasakiella magnetica TaxID=1867952 RepID=A0A1C3RI88_9PROT|nr:hypothetical protein [Candidatus Terasakiella magnetica]SCA56972.1 exported hypothetical protein [Candidatus Terasakiella magnetica]